MLYLGEHKLSYILSIIYVELLLHYFQSSVYLKLSIILSISVSFTMRFMYRSTTNMLLFFLSFSGTLVFRQFHIIIFKIIPKILFFVLNVVSNLLHRIMFHYILPLLLLSSYNRSRNVFPHFNVEKKNDFKTTVCSE